MTLTIDAGNLLFPLTIVCVTSQPTKIHNVGIIKILTRMTAIVCSVNVNGYINITTGIFICAMINTTINKHHMFETVIPCFNQSMLIVVFDHNFFFLKK